MSGVRRYAREAMGADWPKPIKRFACTPRHLHGSPQFVKAMGGRPRRHRCARVEVLKHH